MTNLTEKWIKGELPFGAYYVNRLEEHRIWLYSDRRQTYDNSYEIYEVLAPVPSFEEWQDLKSKLQLKETAYDFDTARLEEENTKLKELLKECRSPINYALCLNLSEEEKKEFKNLLLKIKQVLGED